MSNITIDDDKNCYDLTETFDIYKYLAMRMQKYGAPSDELALLGRLYRDAEATPEMVDGMITEYFLTGKLLDEALEYYKDMQQLEPDNLSLPRFHEVMKKLIDKRGIK